MDRAAEKIKILHIDNSPDVTGASRSLLEFSRVNRSRLESIFIIPHRSKAYTKAIEAGDKVYRLPIVEISKNPLHLILYLPLLCYNVIKTYSIIKRENPDLLHTNDLYNMIFPVIKMTGLSAKPLWTHVRLQPDAYNKVLYGFFKSVVLKYSQLITLVSHAVKERFQSSDNIIVVYDYTKIEEAYPAYQFRSVPDPIRILYLANYTMGKGHEEVIGALDILNKKIKLNAEVVFAGGDLGLKKNRNYKQRLQQSVQEKGLSSLVIFKDKISDVEKEMKTYDLVVVYSSSESFGMVAYEALYYGVPLLVSDCGGPSDFSQHKVSCYVVPKQSKELLASALELLIKDEAMRKEFSSVSRVIQQKMIEEKNQEHLLWQYLDTLKVSG